MAQPTSYDPAHDFVSDEGVNPAFPGSEIDIELAALQTTTDEILANLALIQRDDGEVANASIGLDQLTDAVKAIIGDIDTLADLETDIESVATNATAAAASATAAAASASSASTDAGTATTQAGIATAKAVLTAADRVQTGADAVATAADRVQTGFDVISAAASAAAAASSADTFDDVYLGSKAADPTLDNDGNALVEGQLYWNSTANNLRVYDGAAWNAYSATSGITDVVLDTTPQLGGQLDVNGFALGDGTRELLKFSETASAVNELTIVNAAAGNGPALQATGDDTNIDLNLTPKGTGIVKVAGNRVAAVADPNADRVLIWDDSASDYVAATMKGPIEISGTELRVSETFGVALSDETSAITTGTNKATYSLPFAFTVTSVYATLNTASSSGLVTVDINEAGTTIMAVSKLTIDANEKTSATAATAAVVSDTSIAANAEIGFDIDGAGTGAKGLKVFITGYRT